MLPRRLLTLFCCLLALSLGWQPAAQAKGRARQAKAGASSQRSKAKAAVAKGKHSSPRGKKATLSPFKLGTPTGAAFRPAPQAKNGGTSGRAKRIEKGRDVSGGKGSLLQRINKGHFHSRGKLVIDVGGEGRYRGAVNLNPGELTSTTGAPGRKIPNLVQGVGEKMPFRSGIADRLIVENAPIRPGTAAELSRVVKPKGTIHLSHPADYAAKTHASVIQAVGGTVRQSTVNNITTTVIIAP